MTYFMNKPNTNNIGHHPLGKRSYEESYPQSNKNSQLIPQSYNR
jgi:hypothetical protein